MQEQSKDLHEAFHSQLEKADDPFTVLADYFGRGVFNVVPTWESAVTSHQQQVAAAQPRKELPVVQAWGPQNAGPGSEAKLRKNEGKSVVNLAGKYRPSFLKSLYWTVLYSWIKYNMLRVLKLDYSDSYEHNMILPTY